MITARNQICQDAVSNGEVNSEQILTLEPLPLNEVSFASIEILNILFARI